MKIERWLFSPGTPHLNIDQIASHEPWAIRCSVVENMYKPGEISKDIAILSSENFVVKHYLKISTDPVPENATIDVVGYPGEKKRKWLREKHPNWIVLLRVKQRGRCYCQLEDWWSLVVLLPKAEWTLRRTTSLPALV